MKIDEKAVVPLGWVLAGFTVIVSTAIGGSFWVAAVNFRLTRIEEKLGIPSFDAKVPHWIENGFEAEVECVGIDKLFKSFQSCETYLRPPKTS